MITRNISKFWTNGTKAKVVSICKKPEFVIVEDLDAAQQICITRYEYQFSLDKEEKGVIYSREQLPIVLAYSTTIHKAQVNYYQ